MLFHCFVLLEGDHEDNPGKVSGKRYFDDFAEAKKHLTDVHFITTESMDQVNNLIKLYISVADQGVKFFEK